MKKLKTSQFELYSNEISEDDIGGTLDKYFVRIDSKLITKYFDEIAKGDSYYVSYADDLIRECYDPKHRDASGKKELPLKYFSVLLKNTDGHQAINGDLNEVISSRIANLCGIPTVYNMQVELKGIPHIISLDFLKNDENFMSFADVYKEMYDEEGYASFHEAFDDVMSPEHWCDMIETLVSGSINKSTPNREELMQDVCGDFCLQAIIRLFILGDIDFRVQNFGLVFSDNGKNVKLAPAFDFEYCGFKTFSPLGYCEYIPEYIKYLEEHCPEKLSHFIDTFKRNFYDKHGEFSDKKIQKILSENVKKEYLRNDYMSRLYTSIKLINFILDKYLEDPSSIYNENELYEQYLDTYRRDFV